MIQVLSGSSPSSIVSGTTYTSPLSGYGGTSPLLRYKQDVVPIACAVRNWFLRLSAAPGVGASRTFEVLVNSVPTLVVMTIADDNTIGFFTGGDLDLNVGDLVSMRCTSAGGAATAGFSRWGYEIETVGATQAVFFGPANSGGINSATPKFGGVLSQIANWERAIDGGPSSCTNVVPLDGTVTGYRVHLARGLPNGFLSTVFTIYKSTDQGATFVAQNGSGGTTDTRLTLTTAPVDTQASASFSLAVARGDLLYMREDCSDADGAQWGSNMGVTFTSSEADQWPYCGQPSDTPTSGDRYAPIFSPTPFGWSGAENGRAVSEAGFSAFSLARMIVYCPTPAGAGNTRDFVVRLDGADQDLAVTLSGDTDVIAEDIIHAVPIAARGAAEEGAVFGIAMTLTSSPASSQVSWGFVQDTSEVTAGGGITGDLPRRGVIGPLMVHHFPRETP